MKYAALLLLLISIPVLINLLRQHPHLRKWAFTAIGALLLFSGWHFEAAIIGWPLWNGTAKGLEVSPVDTIALALIVTRRRVGLPPLWGLFAIYGGVMLFSLAISQVMMASFFSFWQFLRIVLVFTAIAGEADRPDLREGLLKGLTIGLLMQLFFVVQQKASGVVQAMGTTYHQNTLGMMVVLSVLPLLGAVMAGSRSKMHIAGITASVLIVAAGGSRATIGIGGAAIVLFALLSLIRHSTPRKLTVAGLGALALVVALPVGMITLKDRFGSKAIISQDTERLAFERAARAMAADYPLGVGPNLYVSIANTKGYAARAGVAWNFANRSAPVHNVYLLAQAETGLLGELSFILLLIVACARGIITSFRNRRQVIGEVGLASGIAVAANALHNQYEFAVFTYFVFALLALNIGLISATIRAVRLPVPPRRPVRPASAVEAVAT